MVFQEKNPILKVKGFSLQTHGFALEPSSILTNGRQELIKMNLPAYPRI